MKNNNNNKNWMNQLLIKQFGHLWYNCVGNLLRCYNVELNSQIPNFTVQKQSWTLTLSRDGASRAHIILFYFFVRKGSLVLYTKEKDHPNFYHQQVQKSSSVMVWACIRDTAKGKILFYDGNMKSFPRMFMHFLDASKTTFCTCKMCEEFRNETCDSRLCIFAQLKTCL